MADAADEYARMYPRRHRYGPPMRPEPWPRVLVGHEQSRDGIRSVFQHPAIVRQRRQINALAYLESE